MPFYGYSGVEQYYYRGWDSETSDFKLTKKTNNITFNKFIHRYRKKNI